jgi:hypothetical protein
MVLRDHGVTEDLIRTHWAPSDTASAMIHWPGQDALFYWGADQIEALIFFVTGESPPSVIIGLRINMPTRINPLPFELCLSPTAALNEISRLHGKHLLDALMWLYPEGLRGTHLRSWCSDPQNGEFKIYHACALITLVKHQSVPVAEALQRITGISEDEAQDIQDLTNKSTSTLRM